MSMNLTNFRPMKSASPDQGFDFSSLFTDDRTWWASPKVDGIRCVIHPTLGPVTNTLKPIKNTFIREYLNAFPELKWLDGELIVGSANDPKNWGNVLSGVMSEGGEPDFKFMVFDDFEAGDMCGYGLRLGDAQRQVDKHNNPRVQLLDQELLTSYEAFQSYEELCVGKGYEGIMLRSPAGKYKKNRSTMKEGGMIKVKRFTDAEARVIGWEPLYLNDNVPVIDNLGLQKRSSHKGNLIPDETRVGALLCEGINGRFAGVQFSIGSGFDDTLRRSMREQFRDHKAASGVTYAAITDMGGIEHTPIGKILTYKFQDHGSIDAPRQPIFKGFRHPDDVTT